MAVGLYGGTEMASQKVVDGKLSRKTVPEKLAAHRRTLGKWKLRAGILSRLAEEGGVGFRHEEFELENAVMKEIRASRKPTCA